MGQLILIMVPTGLIGLLAIVLCLPRVALAQEPAVVQTTKTVAYASSGVPIFMGLSGDEWQAVGVFGGLILGVLTMVGNWLVTWYFKRRHLELAIRQAERGEMVGDEE